VREQQQTAERCLRCGAAMDWRHQTWQCPRCAFKLGCCEGEPQSCPPLKTHAPAEPARAFDGGTSAASANGR
jgi:hypothetical protein